MKTTLAFLVGALAAQAAFAWGPGHDVVGLSVLEKIGAPWEARLKAVDRKRFLAATHLPDNGNPKLLSEKCRAYLVSKGMGEKSVFALHKPELRMALFNALVSAMIEQNDYDVAICTAALSHSLADPLACNHDPVVQYATYHLCKAALDVIPPLSLDFDFAGKEKSVLARRLAALEVPSLPDVLTPEDVYRTMACWDVEADDLNFSHGQPILDAELAYRANKTPENAAKLADILCDLGLEGVRRTLWCFHAAERFARDGKPLADWDFKKLAAKCEQEFSSRRHSRDAARDAFAAPYLPKAGETYDIAVLYDPLGHMASGVLSSYSRVGASQTVGSLRAMKRRAALLDVREAAKGIDPGVTKTLVVFGRRLVGYAGFDVAALRKAMAKYLKDGGRVIWINGDVPGDLDGALRKAQQKTEKGDGYCNPRYPVELDELIRSSLAFGGQAWPCCRRPNGHAGWMWEGSRWWFDPAKLPADAQPVLELRTPEHGTFVMGVRRGNFTYLPLAGIFPYVFTNDKPDVSDGLRLRLDACGEAILAHVLDDRLRIVCDASSAYGIIAAE